MGQDSPASAPPTARATTPLSVRTAMPDPKAQDPLLQRRALTIALVLLASMIVVGFILKNDETPDARKKVPIRRLPWWCVGGVTHERGLITSAGCDLKPTR